MLWKLTEDDLEMMALEQADKAREERPPDWYFDPANDEQRWERPESELESGDPDYEAKVQELIQMDADENRRAAQEEAIWGNVVPFAQPINPISRIIHVADTYFPPEVKSSMEPEPEKREKREKRDEQLQLSTQSETGPVQKKGAAKRLSPYDVAQELMAQETFLNHREAIYFYEGMVYRVLRKEEMLRLIVRHCRSAVKEVGSTKFVDEIYKFILNEPNICCREFEPSPDEVVCLDGVLNLNTMRLKPHTPATHSTRLLQISYSEGAGRDCPYFDQFVRNIAQGDRVLERRIWQALGYLLVEDQRAKCFILLQGVHDSGKSVFGRFVKSLFDSDSISGLELHALSGNFSKSDLMGKALWMDMDLPSGALKEAVVSELKKITGGDPLSADIKYMPRATFINRAKSLFATNHALLSDVSDEAFERRMVVIPFTKTIPQAEQDFDLDFKLWQERDAVAVKAIHAFLDLRANKYQFAGDYPINSVVSHEEDLISKVMCFVCEHCVEADSWTPTDLFFAEFASTYGQICNKNIFSAHFFLCAHSLYPQIEKRRKRVTSDGNPVYGYVGIALKAKQQP